MARHGRPSRSCAVRARGANAAVMPDVIVLDDDQDDDLVEAPPRIASKSKDDDIVAAPSRIASKSKDDPPAEAPPSIASKSKNKGTVFKAPSKAASKSISAKDDVSAGASEAATSSVTGSKSNGAKQMEDDLPAALKGHEVPASAKPADVPSKSDNANSPVSVLEDEGELTEAMVEVEKQLEVERMNEDEQLEEPVDGQPSSNGLLSKLDELLSKTKCYSEFLHERMDEMNEDNRAKKRGRKRKGTATSTQPAKKRQVNTSYEEEIIEEEQEEEEKNKKLQEETAPLVTGGTLKSYQLKGVKWMIALYQNGVNGILADQMGLGKTVQTITFLAHLMSNGVKGPFLICAPLSTLANWINEITRWCPTMQSLLYHGTKEQRAEKRRKHMPRNGIDLPVIVTSYEVLMADVSFLRHYRWTYVVVDEGHRLKNHDCKLFKELKKLRLENTLLLTGTPLQNNLHELWSLLNFILPDIFSSLAEFKAWFAFAERQNMNDQERDETRVEVVKKLHDILRPFLLRRMKSEVEKTLPKKKEIILYACMSKMQKDFHQQLIAKTLEEYLEKGGIPGLTKRKKLNNVCMQLRKNCNHPDILRQEFHQDYDWPPVEQLIEECGKLKLLLDRLLPQLKARGHRVLIFSQMTKLLDIIEYCLSERGLEPYRLDGNVKQDERQTQIQKFEAGEGFVFLLSTRAGGLGINLTSADTAIIYDSDWNPQMDLQAMDRCHRIGQTKPVHVYRLATAHSVECRMLKVANSKLHLEKLVIDKGQFRQERENPKVTLDESDLLALLRDERTEEEELVQSAEISDKNLSRLLDRSDMEDGSGVEEMPMKGPGWETVVNKAGSQNLLSSVEGYRKVDTTATTTVEEAS